jgi:hypothetical protein
MKNCAVSGTAGDYSRNWILPEQAAGKVFFVIQSEARDLLFFWPSKKQQIPRANPALRNDMAGVFPQPAKELRLRFD